MRIVTSILSSLAIVSMCLGALSEPQSNSLHQDEMKTIDGGQTYFCAYPITNPTYKGCQQCYLAKANWIYSDETGALKRTDVYKRCKNNSIDYQCRVQTYPGSPNPYCTKTSHSCGTAASAFTDNLCSQPGLGIWTVPIVQSGYPTIDCTTSYNNATTGPTMGVNCNNVTPGDF